MSTAGELVDRVGEAAVRRELRRRSAARVDSCGHERYVNEGGRLPRTHPAIRYEYPLSRPRCCPDCHTTMVWSLDTQEWISVREEARRHNDRCRGQRPMRIGSRALVA